MNKNSNLLYFDCIVEQANKKNNYVCGDYTLISRNSEYTDFILCDGMGSGPKANMSAIMCASRVIGLLEQGISLYRACEKAVELMHRARTENIPFAAFSLMRILKSGHFTILSYEIPEPIMVCNNIAEILKQRHFASGHEIVSETTGILPDNASIILCSDGVTQAGLEYISGMGWGIESFCKYLNKQLNRDIQLEDILKLTLKQTYKLSNRIHADDTTLACISTRRAKILNLLTGPPANKHKDADFINSFMKSSGKKIVCGSTTIDIVGKILDEEVIMKDMSTSFNEPPRYYVNNIDIASEGAVTLNQVYNLLDVDVDKLNNSTTVFEITKLLLTYDVIHLYIGDAKNQAHTDLSFKQLGVMERAKVIEHIIAKLKDIGKVIKVHTP